MRSQERILVVDDDGEMTEVLSEFLASKRYKVDVAVGGRAALSVMKRKAYDVVVTDLRMDEVDGLDVLAASREDDPTRPVILMTAYGTIDGAIAALQNGAFHYLTKPFRLEEAAIYVDKALVQRGLRQQNAQLRRMAGERLGFRNLIGKSTAMQQLYDLLERLGATSSPVLISGESGTGKELVARALHHGSPRAAGPFVAINCAAISESLLESELFGHVKGAFTGASEHKKGLFVEADGGTLLLDEIGELPLSLQAKLLRVLETSTVRPVGGSAERKVDVRILAATNRNLADEAHHKRFREDLYYRLNVIPVQLPPLRARREDIPALVEHFASRFAELNPDSPRREISAAVMRRLTELPWPGNIREVKHTVERMLILSSGKRVELRDVSGMMAELEAPTGVLGDEVLPLRTMTRRYVEWVLTQTSGNKQRAAQLLGIDPSTVYRLLDREEP